MRKMIHKKYHNAIAGLLLTCTLLMTVPFYGFMHNHTHFTANQYDTEQHQREALTPQHENVVELHNCIACSISQVAQMFFLKSADYSVELMATRVCFVDKPIQQESYSVITSQGRAPPTTI